ncbi:MAG TPA: phosphotransferase [Pseudonocardiaceae bacterium]|nr:phosphotransferase [Pseudonocardiaceae bacterium]
MSRTTRWHGRPRFHPGLGIRSLSDLVRHAGRRDRHAMHDASRDSGLVGRHPVVCHHDPGPNNVVFRDDELVAFINFDTAAPGSPLEDLGYLAWTWCI